MKEESKRSCELFEEFKNKFEGGYKYVVTLKSGWKNPDKCKIISYHKCSIECTEVLQSLTDLERKTASFHDLSVLVQKPIYFFGEHGVDNYV